MHRVGSDRDVRLGSRFLDRNRRLVLQVRNTGPASVLCMGFGFDRYSRPAVLEMASYLLCDVVIERTGVRLLVNYAKFG
jgi:hypothetical protein